MNVKKIVYALIAAVYMAVIPFTVSAEGTDTEKATLCFDNDTALPMFVKYGTANDAGLGLSISSKTKESGNGALCISEDITSDMNPDDNGGVYITAESLGLENFKGCTIQMSVYFDRAATNYVDNFTIFSDGFVWVDAVISANTAGRWSKISLTVPENADNSKIGFTLPVHTVYTGNVAYVDNIEVYNADGTMVANIGDYDETSIMEQLNNISTSEMIILLVVLVVLIVVTIVGIGFVVSTILKRFS